MQARLAAVTWIFRSASIADHCHDGNVPALSAAVDGASKSDLLKLTAVDGSERYFASKDLVMLEFDKTEPTAAP